MTEILVEPPRPEDKESWRELFEGYQNFYKVPENPQVAETVWQWIHDPAHATECLLARETSGAVVGLAHFRDLPRPLSGTTAGFLDDLFVTPEARGSGAADALIAAVSAIGRERGWSWLRWFTAEDNHRARAFYDRVAYLSQWQTYQVDL
ncbi:MAG: GNAT family N-acetyltransferase [Alphaproteobacteria bacterium]|nr:GNAT family N-acetyltransferase [Alphaproteobacteria bacterium]